LPLRIMSNLSDAWIGKNAYSEIPFLHNFFIIGEYDRRKCKKMEV
jgi:hypothetical protein